MPANQSGSKPAQGRVTVLVVDDDEEIRGLLSRYLETHGFDVVTAGTAAQSRIAIADASIDVVLLDLGLPDEDGLVHLKFLQSDWRGPVIVVTGRGDAVERVVGLELGADDYITKPFDFRELVARIRSVLRRFGAGPRAADAPAGGTIRFAGFVLDPKSRRLIAPSGQELPVTAGEFALLQALLAHPGQVLSRDQLMNHVHGHDAGPYDRSIDVQIGRLRRRLGDDTEQPSLIKSVRGAGYMLAAEVRKA
ncbi:winged helix-turn-helix domain-containing protein [Dokdonella immobilis]|uniref:Two-component system, OmpR family, response regulator n=1 Tax=Dokdonella immobilis TaxID=578942 RepID=A0A1I4ZAY6_9GAMM|nr:response regulator transcription factor [Dokdonella immobilis]SFN47452.1 two-component system, OmpR family, response regulator [Dokdonella immobilis]